MLLGYCRVSTPDQDLALQQDALTAAGCDRIFSDVASGAKDSRPGLDSLLSHIRAGDALVVWRLDRLGRNLKHLVSLAEELAAKGVGFKSITEGFDTTTSGGKLIFQIFGAMAEFERNLIQERTMAGLRAARARGRCGGRPKKLEAKVKMAQELARTTKTPIKDICKEIGIGKTTFYARRDRMQPD